MPVAAPRPCARCAKVGCACRTSRRAIFERSRKTAAQRGYGWKWQQYRVSFLARNPLCRMCMDDGYVVAANEVDHVIPHKGSDDPLFWDVNNHQALCKPCHQRKTQSESMGRAPNRPSLRPSAIPVTIVCGPPASGKTRYVEMHKQHGDIVIDLDAIKAQLTGLPWYHPHADARLNDAILERNKQLNALAHERTARHAWFITSAPSAAEREWWRRTLGATTLVLETPSDVCMNRISQDSRRHQRDSEFRAAIRHWWNRYTRDPHDLCIK